MAWTGSTAARSTVADPPRPVLGPLGRAPRAQALHAIVGQTSGRSSTAAPAARTSASSPAPCPWQAIHSPWSATTCTASACSPSVIRRRNATATSPWARSTLVSCEHRCARPLGVGAAGDQPPPGDLPQQGVDRVAHAGGVRLLLGATGRDPVHQQAGLLQRGEDVAGAGVTGEPVGEGGREHGLGGAAQEQVLLLGLHPGEDLAGDEVGDPGAGRPEPAYDVGAVGRGRAGSRGQDDRGAPALGLGPDGVDQGRVRLGHVHTHERGGLGVGQPEGVAADDGQVAEQLRDEPAQRQVPPGQQDHAQSVGRGVEAGVEDPDGGGRQLVGVVHDDEVGRSVPVAAAVEQAGEGSDRSAGARPPSAWARGRWCSQPATPKVLPAPAGATSTVIPRSVLWSSMAHSAGRSR